MPDPTQRHRTAREVMLIASSTQAERQAQWDRVDELIRQLAKEWEERSRQRRN
jgi:hypothetical protein